MIEFECPACARRCEAPEEDAGRKAVCECGNVNIVPPAAPSTRPGASERPSDTPETVYRGKSSQLENLWVFLGFVVVVIVAFWPLRQVLSAVFKTSNWDWYIALMVIAGYATWLGYRILKLNCTSYTVTPENVLIERGILLKKTVNVERSRVKDTRLERTIVQRILGTGNICFELPDEAEPDAVLRNIPEPSAAFDKIRNT